MLQGLVVAVLMAVSLNAQAADATTMVTILEGDALVYRGTGRLQQRRHQRRGTTL